MQIAILGIDLGKNSCSMAGLDEAGHVLLRRRVRRESVIKFVSGPRSITSECWRGLAPRLVALARKVHVGKDRVGRRR